MLLSISTRGRRRQGPNSQLLTQLPTHHVATLGEVIEGRRGGIRKGKNAHHGNEVFENVVADG